jgi:hypothetical protein
MALTRSHEPLVGENLFESVQQKLRARRQSPPRRLVSENLLVGHTRCSRCGASMFVQRPGNPAKRHHWYYVCAIASLSHARGSRPSCRRRPRRRESRFLVRHLTARPIWNLATRMRVSPGGLENSSCQGTGSIFSIQQHGR